MSKTKLPAAGYLEVGTNGRGEVVINLDHDRTGHVVFSPEQARALAHLLLKKAIEAEQPPSEQARQEESENG